jgi:cyclopropane-fatty-acyl-phospholipid synthase
MPDTLTEASSIPGAVALQSTGRGMRRLVDAALLEGLGLVMRDARRGHLHLTLPSGRSAVIGRGSGAKASLALTSYALVWKAMRRGLVGFGDAYVSGDIETENLNEMFRFLLENQQAITARLPRLMRSAPRDVAYHAARRNTRSGSRHNIAAHYDLGNDFYRHWLDAGMSYSSGIYARPDLPLEEAQAAKHSRIIEMLDLRPEYKVLEIGCGWGALAEAIAKHAATIDAITISKEQLEATRERLAHFIADGSASVRFEDYRDTIGSFDRIVSIEMIEAVGEDNWPTYFSTIQERLKPGGAAVIQAITIRDDLYDDYRRNPDFIQRYIFPGGMLPTASLIRKHAERAGLELVEVERFGASYALTVAEWRRRFAEAWPNIAALGFDERFRRMWIYYLTYCEAGFRHGTIDVGLYRLAKP